MLKKPDRYVDKSSNALMSGRKTDDLESLKLTEQDGHVHIWASELTDEGLQNDISRFGGIPRLASPPQMWSR